ncbi:hypothetical protein JCM1393_21200 [Clostridium carnis]
MGGKSYYRKKKKNNNWGQVLQNSFKEFCDAITNNINRGMNCRPNSCFIAARICIYVLIIITLLFSGIGFYSWVILAMLLLILQFV